MKYKVRYFVNNIDTDAISRYKMHYNIFFIGCFSNFHNNAHMTILFYHL